MDQEGRDSPSVWVDVTTLLCWRGRWTGIPRTIGCILKEWMQAGTPNVRACRYNGRLRAFYEVEPAVLDGLFRRQGQPAPSGGPGIRGTHGKAERFLRALCTRLPGNLPPILFELGKAMAGVGREGGRLACELARIARVMAARAWSFGRGKLMFRHSDVLLSPGGSWDHPGYWEVVARLRSGTGLRVVPLIYDLIPHRFPQFFPESFPPQFRSWLTDLLSAADRVVAISENTRRDVTAFAAAGRTPLPPVSVVRLGDTPLPASSARPPRGWDADPPTPFVLSVGTVEIRKNHLLLYHVWCRLVEERGQAVPPLVMAGQRGWLTADLQYQLLHDPVIRDKVLLLEGVNDEELTWLYRNCLFTLYPAHYEGWGLPVAESLAHGKYCISSNTSSLPEIAPGLVGMHDPLDFGGCKALVERALDDEGYRTASEDRIRREYRITTWQDSACQLLGMVTEQPEVRRDSAAA